MIAKNTYRVFIIVAISFAFAIQKGFSQRPDPIEEEQSIPVIDSLELDRTNVEFLITEAMHFLAIENNTKALNSFLKAHQLMPENAAVNSKIAEIYLADEAIDKALYYAKIAFDNDASNYFYAALLANIYTESGDLEHAIATFVTLYDQFPEAPDDYLLELAALYIYNGQPKKALATYDRIEKRLGILEEVSMQKQKILLQENDLEGAIKEGDKLVKAYPTVSQYASALAQIMVSNDKLHEAIKYLENYLENNPNQALAHLELASLYRQNSEVDRAMIHLRKAFSSEEVSLSDKLNNFIPLFKTSNDTDLLKDLGKTLILVHPNNANAFAANGDLYFNLNNRDSALFYYRKAVSFNATNLQLWQNILNLEMEEENYVNVANYAEEALSYFPNQPVLYLYAGSAYFSLKKYRQSINMWQQGAAITFDNDRLKSTFYAQIADAYHAINQNQEAYKYYELAITANSLNYFAINNYTYYLSLEKRNLDRAKILAKQMVEANPENATFLDTYGWVLFQSEDYAQAKRYLQQAAEINPSGTILEHYGDVLFKLEKKEEALEQWERARKVGGASSLINKKIDEQYYYE